MVLQVMQPREDPRDLALLIARSCVGVAALRRKYADDTEWNGDAPRAARVLQDHYRRQLEVVQTTRAAAARDGHSDGIRPVFPPGARGRSATDASIPDPAAVDELLRLLEHVVDDSLTPEDADRLIDRLNAVDEADGEASPL